MCEKFAFSISYNTTGLSGLVHKDKIKLDSAKYFMANITISELMAYRPQI